MDIHANRYEITVNRFDRPSKVQRVTAHPDVAWWTYVAALCKWDALAMGEGTMDRFRTMFDALNVGEAVMCNGVNITRR
jgi:hypothetical protein